MSTVIDTIVGTDITNDTTPAEERYKWVEDNFGLSDPWQLEASLPASWEAYRWRFSSGQYYFSREEDATAFLLRWGGRVM